MLKRLNRYSLSQKQDHRRPGVALEALRTAGPTALLDPAICGASWSTNAPGGRPLGSSRSIASAESAGWTEVVIQGGQELKSDLRNTADLAVLVNTSLSPEAILQARSYLWGNSDDTVNSGPFSCPSNHEVMI